ncbi:MAG: hypothetical protein NUW09_07025 [Deltaproteobacteria bacterium]|nr:hypothetical protein [Deltaproteobacteria bacterium]
MKQKKSTVLRIRVNEDLLDRLDILKGDKSLSGYARNILDRHAEGETAAVDFEALRLRELVDSVGRLNEAEKEIKATIQTLRNSQVWNKELVKDLLFYVARTNFYIDEFARQQLSQTSFEKLNQYVKERCEREKKNIERLFD